MGSGALSGSQFGDALGEFAETIEPSLEGTVSDQAEKARQDWVYKSVWPHAYLQEAGEEGSAHQEYLHANLRRLGLVDENGTVGVRRAGQPRGPITNASIDPNWSGNGYGVRTGGEMHSWRVPISDVVGIGHPNESEVFVRHKEEDE